MDKCVVFTSNNARVFLGDHAMEAYSEFKDTLPVFFNPNMSKVVKDGTYKCPPHHWKIKDNEIIEMTQVEKEKRDADIKKNGVNIPMLSIKNKIKKTKETTFTTAQMIFYLVLGFFIIIFINILVNKL